jgi:hypothetical protein
MKFERPTKRMTLREQLTHAEKCAHDLGEHVHNGVLAVIADYRDLNRPVRKRSNYPTLIALQNSLRRLEEVNEETNQMFSYLVEQMESISQSAQRELHNRY